MVRGNRVLVLFCHADLIEVGYRCDQSRRVVAAGAARRERLMRIKRLPSRRVYRTCRMARVGARPEQARRTMLAIDHKSLLAKGAATVRLRHGQKLVASLDEPYTLYFVVAGLIAIEIRPDEERRQILSFKRAGECFWLSDYAMLPGLRSRAIVATTLLKVPAPLQGAAGGTSLAAAIDAEDRGAARHARLQQAMLGRLTGEEKVVTFLLEEAVRAARPSAREARFLLAMTRQDIADYLGLNADTLSRVLTRLKQSGVIALTGRSDVLVRDIARLRALSPLGEAIERICRNGGTA